jgi:DNA-binding NtrC family response regulator
MTMLLAVTGPQAGQRFPLGEAKVVLGRSSTCDVQLFELEAGRRHLEIAWNGKAHVVTCGGSTNGTWVNGVKIPGGAPTPLRAGDVIAIGQTVFVYQPDLEYWRGEGTDVIVDQRSVELEEARAVDGEAEAPIAAFLLDLVARATGPSDEDDPLGRALSAIAARFSADRAFVVRAEADGRPPKVLKSFGAGPIVVSRTVIKKVVDEKQAVLFGDAAGELSLRGGVSLAAGQIRSLLAAPLMFDERTIGVIHLDRKDRHAYDAADLEAFAAASRLFSLVVLATEGVAKLKQRSRVKRIEKIPMIAESPAFLRVVAEIDRAAKTRSTVLLEGETGSGKEVLARRLHEQSDRADGPFIAVNCGALPVGLAESELFGHEAGAFTGATSKKAGLFEAADGGTIFLDEISETDRATQVKLLRVLQDRVFFPLGSPTPKEVDVRIVSATSKPLAEKVSAGSFRDDLYFRLAVIQVRVPPLRERSEDIGPLAIAFARASSIEAGLSPRSLSAEVIELLEKRRFSGNVRELKNTIERLVILAEGEAIGIGDLPPDLLAASDEIGWAARQGQTLAEVLAQVERAMILRAMARAGGVKVAAAEALSISRVTLDAKLKAYGLLGSEKKFRSGEIPE